MKKFLWLACILLSFVSGAFSRHVSVPIELGRHGEILLHVKVNGHDAVLLLDTGASFSLITTRIGGNLATMPAVSIVEGHTSQTLHIAKGSLNLGSGDVDTAFVVTDLNPTQTAALGVKKLDGLLGMRDLSAFKSVQIDFKHKVVELED